MTNSNLISGVAEGCEPFVIIDHLKRHPNSIIFVTTSDEKAHLIQKQLTLLDKELECLHFPAWDCLPYDRIAPSQESTQQRLKVLTRLLGATKPLVIITSAAALLQKTTPGDFLKNQSFVLKAGTGLDREALLLFLQNKGYFRVETVRDHGEFAVRGDIIDLFPANQLHPIRVDLFGNEIERLRTFDPLSQVTTGTITEIELQPSSEILLSAETITTFRQQYRDLFGTIVTPLYEAISAGRRFGGAEHWLPLFYGSLETLLDYCPGATIIADFNSDNAIRTRLELIHDYYQNRLQKLPGDTSPRYNPVKPEHLYLTAQDWQALAHNRNFWQLTPFSDSTQIDYQARSLLDLPTIRQQQNVFEYLKEFIP